MNTPIQGRIPREALLEWLNGSTPLLQAVKPGRSETCYTFVNIPQQENIDFIFGQENYYSPRVGWHDKFEFCGAYSHQTKLLRLTDTPLTHIADGLTPEENMDFEELLRQVNVQINACVEEIIGNDRANLPVQAITDAAIQRSVQQYCEYDAKEEAIRAFIAASGPAPQFRGWYHAEQWTEAGIAAYLTGPDGYIKAQAEDYIAQNGEDLLAQFLKHDALAGEIQKIEADADSPLHRMKAITQALNRCGAKAVNVTIQKGGTEMTFKVPANGLKGYRISYNAWDMLAHRLAELEVDGGLSKYKALVEAVGCDDICLALSLADGLDQYAFDPKVREPEDVARAALETMLPENEIELLKPFLNMHQYGQAVLEQGGGMLTGHGLMERCDGQPILTMGQEQSQEQRNGMELM